MQIGEESQRAMENRNDLNDSKSEKFSEAKQRQNAHTRGVWATCSMQHAACKPWAVKATNSCATCLGLVGQCAWVCVHVCAFTLVCPHNYDAIITQAKYKQTISECSTWKGVCVCWSTLSTISKCVFVCVYAVNCSNDTWMTHDWDSFWKIGGWFSAFLSAVAVAVCAAATAQLAAQTLLQGVD